MRNNIEIAYDQIQVNVEVDSNLMKQNIETIASSMKYLSSMIGQLKDQIDIHIEKTKNECWLLIWLWLIKPRRLTAAQRVKDNLTTGFDNAACLAAPAGKFWVLNIS
jgi:hypothetical protein